LRAAGEPLYLRVQVPAGHRLIEASVGLIDVGRGPVAIGVAPIPGTTKIYRLEENAARPRSSSPRTTWARSQNAQVDAQGHRYGEASERMVDR
jgi:hypothetical protein